jgi:Asp/Glu/hydantoin racemase
MKQGYHFLLVQALCRPGVKRAPLGKEASLMNYAEVAPFLDGIAWDLHPGAPSLNDFGAVETREEFALIGARRLPIVREACESGRYNAIVLLGGGDPGYFEAQEIGHSFGIPVTSCASAQMHIATMLGNKFSVLDIAEMHNMRMRDVVIQYRLTDRCASIRNINFHLPRPSNANVRVIEGEKERATRGATSVMLDTAIREIEAAIEDDGADVMIIGCSAAYWMQPYLQQRLDATGWRIPVLEGYRCAILQAKLLVDLGIDASGLAFPSDRPSRWRRRKVF